MVIIRSMLQLLIPIASVEKISKEKTVKILPNAIGVATSDERHVFGSFMSRDSAYRLMVSIWQPDTDECAKPALKGVESSSSMASTDLPATNNNQQTKSKGKTVAATLDVPKSNDSRSKSPDSNSRNRAPGEVSESVEEDSSSANSSNESPSGTVKEIDMDTNCMSSVNASNADGVDGELRSDAAKHKHLSYKFMNYEIPTTIHIGYLALALAIFLVFTASILVYQIYSIQHAPKGASLDDDIDWVSRWFVD